MKIGYPHLERVHSHIKVSDLFKDNIVQGVNSLRVYLTAFRMSIINIAKTQYMLVRIEKIIELLWRAEVMVN